MKKLSTAFLYVLFALVITGCQTASPEQYFDRAVLNFNLVHGFAGNGIVRELDQPSVEMVNGNRDQVAPMKRKKIIDDKIAFFEANRRKVEDLKMTDDAKDILTASIALHDYVLPVYKNEYSQLAAAYDAGMAATKIEELVQSIHDKYSAGFEKRYLDLETAGKAYASKHDIKVQWN